MRIHYRSRLAGYVQSASNGGVYPAGRMLWFRSLKGPDWPQKVRPSVSSRFPHLFIRLRPLFATLAVLTLFGGGCGKEDPISPDEEHYEAEGLVLVDSGNRFFRYFQGKIDAGDGRVDHLEVPHGELTSHWSIWFLDANGAEMAPPSGPAFEFTWVIGDPSIVEVVQDEGEEGTFEFHLRGLKVDETTIVLQISHEGHADFRTIPIPVHVEA